MRFAYADPPYPGLARRYYGTEEVDHPELIARVCREFPDGWALSTSSEALRDVWAICPAGARVACWVKGPRPCVSWRPRSAWEPLIVVGGRPRRLEVAEDLSDVLLWGGRQHSHPDALVGMKPAAFCEWMFRQLGAMAGDELVDLFPGSGAVGRAWSLYAAPVAGAGGHDPSPRESDDRSRPGRHDASARAAHDGSVEYSRDPSHRGPRDGPTRRPSTPDTSCLAGAERRLRGIAK